MKLGIIYALIFGLSIMLFSTAHALTKFECKVETGDVGTIVGRGINEEMAFDDAATKCYERRETKFVAKHKRNLDFETGEMLIDVCANIKCQ